MRFFIILVLFCLSIPTLVMAALDEPSESDDDVITMVRALIEDQKYRSAISELDEFLQAEPENPDAWNLLGYAHRNLGNLERANTAYDKALELEPQHKGALEYQGELFLQMGDITKAKQHRARLAELCPTGCEELEDLDSALDGAS